VWVVEAKPELAGGSPQGKPIFANMRLGALVLLAAENTEEYRIEVGRPMLTPPAAGRNLEVAFELANIGNAHIFPEPRLTVLNARKEVVARTVAESKRFFPGQKDSLTLTWGGTLPPGDYTAVLTVGYGGNHVFTQELPLHVDTVTQSSGQ